MGETYDAGTLTAELDLDSSKLLKGVQEAKSGLGDVEKASNEAGEALKTLSEIGEALGLAEAFNLIKEGASECLKEFDTNTRAMRSMSAAISDINVGAFKEMSETLASTSRNSVAAEESAIGLASRFGLTDEAIGSLLPQVNKFAEVTGTDMPQAMMRMSMAVSSGETSPRRLGMSLTDVQKQAFKAGDAATRTAILVEAMGDKMKNAGDTVETAGFAMTKMSNQSGEAMAAIGGLIDQPFAEFFSAVSAVVKLFTDAVNALSPGLKEVIGYFVAGGIGLTSMGLAVGSAMKGWSVLSGVLAPLAETILPAVSAGLTGILSGIAMLVAPVALVVAGFVGLATAYGVFKNAMDGKVTGNVLDALKEGLARAKEDIGSFFEGLPKEIEVEAQVHMTLVPVVQGMDFGKEEKTPGFERKGGDFDELNKGLNAKGVDMSGVGKYASDRGTGAMSDGVMDFGKTLTQVAEETHKAWQTSVIATADGVANSFNATADANADLQEAMAKQKDAQLSAAANAGGVWADVFAGVTADMSEAQKERARSDASPSAQTAGGVVQAATSAAGGGIGAAAGVVSSAMSFNAAGVVSGAMSLLQESTSFSNIIKLLNAMISTLMQGINPILNVIVPALSVVLNMISSIVKQTISTLTPMLQPIMQLITTIMLVIQPFVQVIMEIIGAIMKMDPGIKLLDVVISAVATVLMWIAEAIINDFVNPLIAIWDGLIDAIDSLVGWADIDLSGLKIQTVSLDTNVDAVDAVTQSMNDLDQSSQNIPEGFKVALTAYNSGAVSSAGAQTPTSTGGPLTGLGALGNIFGNNAPAYTGPAVFNPWGPTTGGLTALMPTAPTAQSKMAVGASGGTVNIQNVTVQAATSDLIGQIQANLKNLGYLKSGTPMMGATSRSQYGSA